MTVWLRLHQNASYKRAAALLLDQTKAIINTTIINNDMFMMANQEAREKKILHKQKESTSSYYLQTWLPFKKPPSTRTTWRSIINKCNVRICVLFIIILPLSYYCFVFALKIFGKNFTHAKTTFGLLLFSIAISLFIQM